MTDRELFELSSKAFNLMTVLEQAVVLTLFRISKESIVTAWINSVAKTAKSGVK